MGNTLFLGFLGASAYFGYYTYRYSTQEVENLIEETKKPENQFPGSDVSPTCFSNVTKTLMLSSYRCPLTLTLTCNNVPCGTQLSAKVSSLHLMLLSGLLQLSSIDHI